MQDVWLDFLEAVKEIRVARGYGAGPGERQLFAWLVDGDVRSRKRTGGQFEHMKRGSWSQASFDSEWRPDCPQLIVAGRSYHSRRFEISGDDLRSLLATTTAPASGALPAASKPAKRTVVAGNQRGPRPMKLEQTIERMASSYAGRMDELRATKQKVLASEFRVSRETANKARERVLEDAGNSDK